jgi:UDP-N-acetylglucosamine--N-acetylmuramyl-(pentapeptide) pyrophosphoryl-undecaprenol N-acetylglucosamine transferase
MSGSTVTDPRSGATEKLKLLIAGGGTGGHVIPALAVAREWLSRAPDREAVFVGTQRGLETRLVPAAGLKLETIRSLGLKGMGPVRLARNLAQLAPALADSAAILRRHRVAAVFGVGGYAAGPVMLLAAMNGLPTVLFEPNAAAGFSNRLLAMFVTRMATGYASVAESWGARARFTGCPVRPEFFSLAPIRPKPPYRLLITGGSQGARVINRALINALDELKNLPLSLIHQTGERDYNEVRSAYETRGVQAEVAPFFTAMSEKFAQADLIICRAGANAVAEIAAAGRAALFIPFGAATDNHQLRNAEEMARAGAARLIPEPELSGERLAREVSGLIAQPQQLAELGRRARQLARPHAARDIADLIDEVIASRT